MIVLRTLNKKTLWLALLSMLLSCKTVSYGQVVNVDYDNPNIVYQGRVGMNSSKKVSEIYWSGSSLKINFEGTSVKAILEDQNGTNYFNILLDNQPIRFFKLKKGKHEYTLVENLSNEKHTLEISKRNEWTFGTTSFHKFMITGRMLPMDKNKPLFIEFYGDSITTGHGNEDTSGNDSATGDVTNNYTSYAAITARKLNAEYACIARGGIGVMVSWFHMIMPEMYNRLNPNDESSIWDFNVKHPDIVVINLFQNDSWIVNHADHKEFKRRFGEQKPSKETIIKSYETFVQTIRGHHPNAKIVCLLGNMDITKDGSEWPSYVQSAVDGLGDKNVFTCFVPFKDSKAHPSVAEHQIMAKKLSTLIKEEILHKI